MNSFGGFDWSNRASNGYSFNDFLRSFCFLVAFFLLFFLFLGSLACESIPQQLHLVAEHQTCYLVFTGFYVVFLFCLLLFCFQNGA